MTLVGYAAGLWAARWHVTLMSWLRDYVYIPLGGSRCGAVRRRLNVVATFFVSGLWHGASWTFVLWGLWHALFVSLRVPLLGRLPRAVRMALMFGVACLGWVFFRSATVGDAFARLALMLAPLPLHGPYGGFSAFYVIIAVTLTEALTHGRPYCAAMLARGPLRLRPVRWALYYGLLFALFYWGGEPTTFIYFQF